MKIDTTRISLTTAEILCSKCKRLSFPRSHSLAAFWFGRRHKGKLKVTSESLSAWTKTFEGRETNLGEHGETIRLALFCARSGHTWQRVMKFCYLHHYVIIVVIVIFFYSIK